MKQRMLKQLLLALTLPSFSRKSRSSQKWCQLLHLSSRLIFPKSSATAAENSDIFKTNAQLNKEATLDRTADSPDKHAVKGGMHSVEPQGLNIQLSRTMMKPLRTARTKNKTLDYGKLLRKKGSSSHLFPAAVMSFWAVLSNFFAVTVPERPITTVTINDLKLSALFDTGSSFTLINSNLKRHIINGNTPNAKGNPIKLCAANGQILNSKGTYVLDIKFSNHSFQTAVQFIDNLQLPCIIGMDFMSKANISICASSKRIKIGSPIKSHTMPIISSKKIQLPAFSETLCAKTDGSRSYWEINFCI